MENETFFELATVLPKAGLVLHSHDLFGDSRLVLIQHNQDWYRLMITKQGKLILTK